MQKNAPYAEIAIPIHLQSINGSRYRILSCVECAEEFLSREGEVCYRVGVRDLPEETHIDEVGGIQTKCGHCQQKYTVFFSLQHQQYKADPLLFQQAQTIFLTTEPIKHTRNTFCLDCHHAYLAVSDRISMVSDSVIDIEHIAQGLGPVEVRCKFQKCKQRWQIRI